MAKRARRLPCPHTAAVDFYSTGRSGPEEFFQRCTADNCMAPIRLPLRFQTGYVLFDSWYAWSSFIQAVRKIKKELRVICRLKDSKVLYTCKGNEYRLSALYQKIKRDLSKSKRTGFLLKKIKVKMPGGDEPIIIVFAKG